MVPATQHGSTTTAGPARRRVGVAAALLAICWAGPMAACRGEATASAAADVTAPAASSPAAVATEACCPADPDVWVVSTRHLPEIGCVPTSASPLVERLVPCGPSSRWETADVADLLGDPGRPLLVFIHGNRYESGDAKSQGLLLARRCAQTLAEGTAVRTVILSWPSAQQGILLRDGRAKYDRAVSDGRYLAWLLGKVDPARPVALVAYSYGAIVSLEALDNLVRASHAGRDEAAPWMGRGGRVHMVLVAAAVRHDALAPRGVYRRVTDGVDRLTLVNNTRDLALKFFEFLDPTLRADALGREQMPARWIPPGVEFVQVDAADIVGKDHRFVPYLSSPPLRRRIAAGALDGLTAE